jgi:hypothetical protein
MRYMLLIYTNEATDPGPGAPGFDEMMAGYGAFTQEVQEKGVMLAGDPLEPVASSRSVRVRDGKVLATAGPFAETAEQLGGYYILECKDIDEAADFASRIPGAARGCVEIRPIREM